MTPSERPGARARVPPRQAPAPGRSTRSTDLNHASHPLCAFIRPGKKAARPLTFRVAIPGKGRRDIPDRVLPGTKRVPPLDLRTREDTFLESPFDRAGQPHEITTRQIGPQGHSSDTPKRDRAIQPGRNGTPLPWVHGLRPVQDPRAEPYLTCQVSPRWLFLDLALGREPVRFSGRKIGEEAFTIRTASRAKFARLPPNIRHAGSSHRTRTSSKSLRCEPGRQALRRLKNPPGRLKYGVYRAGHPLKKDPGPHSTNLGIPGPPTAARILLQEKPTHTYVGVHPKQQVLRDRLLCLLIELEAPKYRSGYFEYVWIPRLQENSFLARKGVHTLPPENGENQ